MRMLAKGEKDREGNVVVRDRLVTGTEKDGAIEKVRKEVATWFLAT